MIIREDELMHYGVLGMKWGVHRAKRVYTKGNIERGNAITSKHTRKINQKLNKLEQQEKKLTAARQKQILTTDKKAAKYLHKAGEYTRKSEKMLSFNSVRRFRKWRANVNTGKYKSLYGKIESTKAKIASNQQLQNLFKQGLSDLDKNKIELGKKAMS